MSSAKGARPADDVWADELGEPLSNVALADAAAGIPRGRGGASPRAIAAGLDDRLEAGAPTEVCGERGADDTVVDPVLSPECGEPDDDARRAEAALGGRRGVERVHEWSRTAASRPLERRHVASGDPEHRRHARDPRLAVHEHRAAAALALRGAPVLDVEATELVAKRVEKRSVAWDGDGAGRSVGTRPPRRWLGESVS